MPKEILLPFPFCMRPLKQRIPILKMNEDESTFFSRFSKRLMEKCHEISDIILYLC